MTQNKTELQEALDDYYCALAKTAQAYADLPEKIRGMKTPSTNHYPRDLRNHQEGYNQAINEILTLLEKPDV